MQKKRRMTKLIAVPAYAICLAIIISFLPAAVLTARAESETPTTGTGTEEDPYVVYSWAELKSKMAEGGFITLGEDAVDPIKSSASYLYIPDNTTVTLDLNGHVVNRGLTEKMENGSVIRSEGDLVIKDSSDSGEGCITGGNEQYYGGGIYIWEGNLTVLGGNIQGNKAGYGGGGVSIDFGNFTMEGGVIRENQAERVGGGYYAYDGKSIMKGGKISDNTGKHGGGIYLQCNSLSMTGGEISGNTAREIGGGVALNCTAMSLSGDGLITGNTAQYGGGLGSADENCTFYISGGTISDNTAVGNESKSLGGGIYCNDYCGLSLSGGTITGNAAITNGEAVTLGGGIYTDGGEYSFYSISGAPIVTGNTAGGETDNFYLKKGFFLELKAALTEGAVIGMTFEETPTEEQPVVFTERYRSYSMEKPSKYFVSDNPLYSFSLNNIGEAQVNVLKKYELYIAGTQVTSANADDLTVLDGVSVSDGGYISYNADYCYLAMKDAIITAGGTDDIGYGIQYNGPDYFELYVEGKCKVLDEKKRNKASFAIAFGNFEEWPQTNSSLSTTAEVDIIVTKGSELQLIAGDADAAVDIYTASCGVSADRAKLNLRGKGTLITKGGSATFSYGIGSNTTVIADNCIVEAYGSDLAYMSFGIASKNFTSEASTLTAVAGGSEEFSDDGTISSSGFLVNDSFIINGGTIKAVSGMTSEGGSSIAVDTNKSVIINSGSLLAVSNGIGEQAKALDFVPTLAAGITAGGSQNADGSGSEAYDPEKNDSYKWFCAPYEAPVVKDGLVNENGKWMYYQNGKINKDFYGFVDFSGSKFLVANGEVVSTKNGLAQDPNDKDIWYFCAGGKVLTGKSGLVQYPAKEDNWFIVQNGRMDTTYSGFVDYNGGKFFVARGKLVRKDGLVQDPNNKADWYFLSKGQVQKQKTGVVIYNKAGFYVVNGKLDTSYTGKAQYNGKTVNIVKGRMK